MPRNEFKAGDEEDPDVEAILYVDNRPYATIRKSMTETMEELIDEVIEQRNFYRPPHGHSGKSEDEVTDQEVDPVEDDPHMWPAESAPTLAELRKSGRSTTAAHLARPATSE